MRVAVTTPAGHVGRHVLHDLVRAGLRPLALVRDPSGIDPLVRDDVDVRVCDLTDAAVVHDSLVGVDSLYLVAPTPSEADDPVAAHAALGERVAAAVAAQGVGRVVFQSSGGAELREGCGEIDGLARIEQSLDALVGSATIAVAHLRCGFFYSNLPSMLETAQDGVVSVLLPTDHRIPWVAPRDIAGVATSLLVGPVWEGRRVQGVHGPADVSWDEACAVAAEATGRPVRAERIPDDAMREALAGVGMSPAQVEGIVGMSTGMRDGYVPEQPRTAATTTPTTLRAWALEHLG